jgi:hypothetical protein
MERTTMKRVVLGLAMLVAACGGDDAEGPALTSNTWVAVLPGEFDCAVGLYFGTDGAYEYRVVCALEGGGLGIQSDQGEYEVEGSRVHFFPMYSSCADRDGEPFTDHWVIDNDQLTLTEPEGTFVLDPYTDDSVAGHNGSNSSVGKFGCWGDGGSFFAMPVRPI